MIDDGPYIFLQHRPQKRERCFMCCMLLYAFINMSSTLYSILFAYYQKMPYISNISNIEDFLRADTLFVLNTVSFMTLFPFICYLCRLRDEFNNHN